MEGFSLPPLEAIENDCLVLASDIPVHREVFGDSIIYFDQFKSDDILSKMKYVLSLSPLEKEKFIKKGLAQAKKYSWEKTARETLRVYENSSSASSV
jgi:glycosyltransferase involved in cell wall biosynthesis